MKELELLELAVLRALDITTLPEAPNDPQQLNPPASKSRLSTPLIELTAVPRHSAID